MPVVQCNLCLPLASPREVGGRGMWLLGIGMHRGGACRCPRAEGTTWCWGLSAPGSSCISLPIHRQKGPVVRPGSTGV